MDQDAGDEQGRNYGAASIGNPLTTRHARPHFRMLQKAAAALSPDPTTGAADESTMPLMRSEVDTLYHMLRLAPYTRRCDDSLGRRRRPATVLREAPTCHHPWGQNKDRQGAC